MKLGFYLTPNNYAALKLHATINNLGTHQDSKVINSALSSYLRREIAALESAPAGLDEEARFLEALKKLL